jgi:hypothetical protein
MCALVNPIVWPDDDVGTACQRERALALPEALAREVHRGQRRRAGGIDRHAGPTQVEHVRDAIGGDAERHTEIGIGVDQVGIRERDPFVVAARDADEHASGRPGQPLGHETGILQSLPGRFEQEAMLGIDAGRLARGDAEERCVHLVDAFEKGSPRDVRLAWLVRVGVVERAPVPAISRDVADDVPSGAQESPEGIGIVDPRGEAAADADDCDPVGGIRSRPFVHPAVPPAAREWPSGAQRVPCRWRTFRPAAGGMVQSERWNRPVQTDEAT